MSRGPERLYETLARYQWWRRRWSGARPGEGLEIRKRLTTSSSAPTDGGEALDRWLFDAVAAGPRARILDVGCGFGASLLRWVRWSAGTGLGVTSSQYQVARAAAEAARQGLADRARFAAQDYADPVAGPFDAALAIESLGHAFDLQRVYANVRDALVPGGRFVQVEDLLRDAAAAADVDVAELARCWSSPPLRDLAAVRTALAAAGLRIRGETDLTARVAPAERARIDRQQARLKLWRAFPLPAWRRLTDAFLGGCALERLYAADRACYVVFVCERE